jgi:DNA (cytosine-5)-methyltransferase 1
VQVLQEFSRTAGVVTRSLLIDDRRHDSKLADLSDPPIGAEDAWWQSFLRGAVRLDQTHSGSLRVLDAFSGCGGLAVGVAEAAAALGRSTHFHCAIDVDTDGLSVHQHNLGTRHVLAKNVSTIVDYHVSGRGPEAKFAFPPEIIDSTVARQAGRIDLLVAGPPCQGHSNLNNRSRRSDPRNQLFITAVALAVALKARGVLIENVPEVQRDRGEVLTSAISILRASGYGCVGIEVLKATDYGAAQSRRRLFLVAMLGEAPSTECDLARIRTTLASGPRPLSWAIGDLLDRAGTNQMDSVPELSKENLKRIDYLFRTDRHDLPDRKRPDCHRNGTTYKSVYGRMHWDKPSQTITTGFMTPGRGRYIHPLRPRVLTPREAARVQFFPDSFDFTCAGAMSPSRSSLAKWIGDAVPPILGYAASLPLISRL